MARVATVISVSIGTLSQQSQQAPPILFGVLAYFAVFSTMFLPETGRTLPKSLEDIKSRIESGKERNLFADVLQVVENRLGRRQRNSENTQV